MDAAGYANHGPMAASLTPQTDLERAQDILARRPRLAMVLIAVDDLTANRRSCRLSIDVSSGIIRVFRENLERQVPLEPPAPAGPSG